MAEPSSRFAKTERLRSSSDFRSVLTKGKSIRDNGFALYYTQALPEAGSRLGILVAKRVVKRAVDRNAIKRAVRESFRRAKRRFGAPVDIVVRAVSYDKSLKQNELQNILDWLFRRAEILDESEQ